MNIIDYKGKNIRKITIKNEEKFNLVDIFQYGLGYKKPNNAINKIKKTIEENTQLTPNWGKYDFVSKENNKIYSQAVVTHKQLVFILSFVNRPQTVPLKLWLAENFENNTEVDIFDLIESTPTTPSRLKINNRKRKQGMLEPHINLRTGIAKLNTFLIEYLAENHKGIAQKVFRIFIKTLYGRTPSELCRERGVSDSERLHETFNPTENRVIRFVVEQMIDMCVLHKGTPSRDIVYKYAHKASQQGIGMIKAMDNMLLPFYVRDNSIQSNFDYMVR
jgi:hypothetical protein